MLLRISLKCYQECAEQTLKIPVKVVGCVGYATRLKFGRLDVPKNHKWGKKNQELIRTCKKEIDAENKHL